MVFIKLVLIMIVLFGHKLTLYFFQGVTSDELTILKLGGYAFAGKYDEAVGSVVIFEDTSKDDEDTKLKYLGHTTKVLRANRIFLKEKPKSETVNTEQKAKEEHVNDLSGT